MWNLSLGALILVKMSSPFSKLTKKKCLAVATLYLAMSQNVLKWLSTWTLTYFMLEETFSCILSTCQQNTNWTHFWHVYFNSHCRRLPDEIWDLLWELVRTAHHHAVQCSWVLWNVNADCSNFEDSGIACSQPSLCTVQCLRLSNTAFYHRPV